VLAFFQAAHAGAHVVARAASRWIVGQPLAAGFELVKVADGLRWAQARSEYTPMLTKSAKIASVL
jgi:hypothetical protein